MMDASNAELTAIRGEFCLLVARWRLTQVELHALLGGGSSPIAEGRVLPDVLVDDAERRMRLLLRLDKALQQLAPDLEVAVCLRDQTGQADGLTPLDSLRDILQLRRTLARVEGANGESLRSVLTRQASQDQ